MSNLPESNYDKLNRIAIIILLGLAVVAICVFINFCLHPPALMGDS